MKWSIWFASGSRSVKIETDETDGNRVASEGGRGAKKGK
jgi:hypothetical protein